MVYVSTELSLTDSVFHLKSYPMYMILPNRRVVRYYG